MLCDEIKRQVYFFIDGSLTEHTTRDFKTHLSICPDCETRTQVHVRIRRFVLSHLTPQPAPERLKTRLARSLRAFRDEWSRS
jgi:anti-sigma factor (TIGR02949 family)